MIVQREASHVCGSATRAVAELPHSAQSMAFALPQKWNVAQWVTAAVVFGCVCRLSQYAAGTSLWYDESFVALNVLHKGAGALLGALEWDESAPPGFLIVERFTTAAAGRSEYAFRLVPLLAGLATVICFAFTARRICGNGPAWLWSVLMLAASTKLIVHAATLKHFTLDTLATVLIVWSALKVRTNANSLEWMLAWGILGAAGIWLSFASLFSFAGTSVVLLVAAVCARRPREIAPLAAANLLVLISLLTLADPIRAQLGTQGLLGYWSRAGANAPSARPSIRLCPAQRPPGRSVHSDRSGDLRVLLGGRPAMPAPGGATWRTSLVRIDPKRLEPRQPHRPRFTRTIGAPSISVIGL